MIAPSLHLRLLGVLLLLMAVFGVTGVLGPTEKQSLLGGFYWANHVHAFWQGVLGCIMLAAAFLGGPKAQRRTLLGYVIYAGIGVIGDTYRLTHVMPENPYSGPPSVGNLLFLLLMIAWGATTYYGARKRERAASGDAPLGARALA